jgi:hypothetical protein
VSVPALSAALGEPPAPVPAPYLGVWLRRLLQTAQQQDTTSQVFWLQTARWHADLRIPPGRPDFTGVAALADCDGAQLAWLATQQGFCGLTQVENDRCTWHRLVDFQPPSGSRDIGRMAFDGERVTERGVEADYLEVWERLPGSRGGTAALELAEQDGEAPARPAWLLVAGDCFFYVRGRSRPLPAAADLAGLIDRLRPSREVLLEWLDVELSFGCRSGPAAWRIGHSSLPFREGQVLAAPGTLQRRGHALVVEGDGTRRWRILDWDMDGPL